nr:retrotransposon protein, putative, Ty1-copia subclass [Tanacetum cinerariifolium]
MGNPFAVKRGEDHTVLHLLKNEEKGDDLPYLKFRKFKQLTAQIINKQEEHAFPTATYAESSTSYQPPHDAIIGPVVYPPARQNPQPTYKPDYQFGYPQRRGNAFNEEYGEYHNSQWTLPPTWMELGVMLVLPADPGLWSDQWRTAYPSAYSALETIADDPQNITSQVRQLIIMEYPYKGSTDEQDRAYRDLDRITCEDTKNLWSFLPQYQRYSFYNPSENKVFVTQNAEFFENDLIDLKASGRMEDLELIQEEDTNPSLDTSLDHEEDD